MSEVTLTAGERRALWLFSGAFLLILVGLFFWGLFQPVQQDHPLLPGLYWMADIAAGISAAILASTISGFLTLKLKRDMPRNGKIAIQASGGFAVFVLVLWLGPRNQMQELADNVFANLVQDCQQAVGNRQLNPNGLGVCTELANRYPNRPEAWRYLATWYHRADSSRDSFQKASQHYRRALSLYFFEEQDGRWAPPEPPLTGSAAANALEVLAGYAAAQADWCLTAHRDGLLTPTELDRQLRLSEGAARLVAEEAGEGTDPYVLGKAYDIRGKAALYRYFLIANPPDETNLANAIHLYDEAIGLRTHFRFFLRYHRFLATILLNDHLESAGTTEAETERRLFESMLDDWHRHLDHQANAMFATQIKTMMRSMRGNARDEGFVVTRPFGSRRFAGGEFVTFLHREPDLDQRFRELIES